MPIGTGPISAKRATAEEWEEENPTLDEGELGFERDTGRAKVGDGDSSWNSLDYLGQTSNGGGGDGD